ncbi:MAG: nitroreductase family deazaflavin-dependent oxidoreductase [Nitrospinae bacterium]|nr:nitroreductase family deazaflavin-dependent oxidoreductase [Nitrospinota bacterium]
MATTDFTHALASTREIEITVTGRRTGRKISLPVWFVHEGRTLYLLPVKGSDSAWYKNVLQTPALTLSSSGTALIAQARPVTDPNNVRDIVEKFRRKYGRPDVQRYYSKFDVGLEVSLG